MCDKYMMFVYKIAEVKICVSLREHHDITFAENGTAAYMPCLEFHRKLNLTSILLKFSQIQSHGKMQADCIILCLFIKNVRFCYSFRFVRC